MLTSETHADLASEAWLLKARLFLHDVPIGTAVTVTGGFGHGLTGHLVGVRRHASADYPVVSILVGDDVIGGFNTARIEPADAATLTEFSEGAEPYFMECYGCGALGTNHVFGFGFDRKCFACGSYSIHTATKGSPA